jgi:ketosteroid isomerase-like protein
MGIEAFRRGSAQHADVLKNRSAPMPTSEENKQLVLASYRAFATRDKDQIASYFALDAEWIAPERNGTAVALGTPSGFVGRDAIVNNLTEDVGGRLFLGSKVELLAAVADGDHVVVEQLFQAALCNGRPYKMIQCFIFVVRDGLIRQIRSFFDTALGFEQIFGEEAPRQLG